MQTLHVPFPWEITDLQNGHINGWVSLLLPRDDLLGYDAHVDVQKRDA